MADPELAKLFVEFAKFGFYGTLVAALVGAGLILALACLSAWTPFKIDGWALVVIAAIVFLGTTAFGYLSLWQAPSIMAELGKQQMKLGVSPAKKE